MDATGSASGTGFDAALKALDQLESDVALTRDAVTSAAGIALDTAPPAFAIIAAEPIDEIEAPIVETPSPVVTVAPSIGMIALDMAAEPEPEPIAAKPAVTKPETAVLPDRSSPSPEAVEVTTPQPEAPVAVEPAADVPPAKPAKASKLPALAVGLGLISSAMAGAGLIVVTRTVNSAALVVADARERQAQMKLVGKLIGELDAMRARQLVLLQREQQIVATAPLSAQDLDQRIGALKNDLAQHDQSEKMLATVHEGQNELNETLISIGMKAARIEAKLDGAQGHPAPPQP